MIKLLISKNKIMKKYILGGIILLAFVGLIGIKAYAGAGIGGTEMIFPTTGSTISITLADGLKQAFAIWSSNENETVNLSSTLRANENLVLEINNGGATNIITFGDEIISNGVLTIAPNKTAVITFVCDGVNFIEMTRQVGSQFSGTTLIKPK